MEENSINEIFSDDTSEAEFMPTEDGQITHGEALHTEEEKSDELSEIIISKMMSILLERFDSLVEEKRKEDKRINDDVSEFYRLFPNVDIDSIPSEVKDDVNKGIPLTASYALYEKKLKAERERIEGINRQNAQRSSGAAGKNTQKEYFSPDEVRTMSQSEVRANYKKIIESMKKWN